MKVNPNPQQSPQQNNCNLESHWIERQSYGQAEELIDGDEMDVERSYCRVSEKKRIMAGDCDKW